MPPTNDFVPFCNENTGTNLPTQSAYLANPALPIGNQPGIASSSLNNKAIRQGSTMAAVLAAVASNLSGNDMLDNQNTADHAIPAALLGVLTAVMKYHSPVTTTYITSSGNHNLTIKFQIAQPTISPTIGATYSDGTTTYTVKTALTGTQLDASGSAFPAAVAGTLTKLTGTGDATLTFYSYRKPLYLKVRAVGGGGGGGGGGTAGGGNGGNGGDTDFGSSFLVAGGGSGGAARAGGGGAGGGGSIGSASGIILGGGGGGVPGASNSALAFGQGGNGASTAFGGGGSGGIGNSGGAASANTGAGGGGGSGPGAANSDGGVGGGAAGYVDAVVTTPLATYAYSIGTTGSAGSAGTSGFAGAAGAAGLLIVEEHYQ